MVITAAAKRGLVEGAERWFEKILGEGLKPQVVAYNAVMAAAAKQGDLTVAQRWFERMQRDNVNATRISFKTLINAAARARNLKEAEKWFGRMLSVPMTPDAIAYNTLMKAAENSGNFSAVEHWHLDMKERGVAPSNITFGTLVVAACAFRKADRALGWAQEAQAQQMGLTTPGYAKLLDLCHRTRNLSMTESVLAMMAREGRQPDADMYAATVLTYAKCGAERKAEAALSRMVAEGKYPSTADLRKFRRFPSLKALAERMELERLAVSPAANRKRRRWVEAQEKRSPEYERELWLTT